LHGVVLGTGTTPFSEQQNFHSVVLYGEDDLTSMWRETIMIYFKALSWHLSGGTEEKLQLYVYDLKLSWRITLTQCSRAVSRVSW
jgi:hypothetical protein